MYMDPPNFLSFLINGGATNGLYNPDWKRVYVYVQEFFHPIWRPAILKVSLRVVCDSAVQLFIKLISHDQSILSNPDILP